MKVFVLIPNSMYIQLVVKQSKLLILLYQVLKYAIQMDFRFKHFFRRIQIILCFVFQVCCQGSQCSNDTVWVASTVSSKNGLTITLTISSTHVLDNNFMIFVIFGVKLHVHLNRQLFIVQQIQIYRRHHI